MNQDNTGGVRCHDADACAFGQNPCPTPAACGCSTPRPVKDGTHKPAEAVHQIAEPQTKQSEALARAGLAAIRLAREGDQQAAENIRAQQARIAELEAQLEAIGAGGVKPLRKPAAAPQAVQAAVPVAYLVDPRDGGDTMLISADYEKLRGDGFRENGWTVIPLYAHPAEGVPAQAGAYAEARECEHCNHVGINDAANGIASCTACKWNGDSPKEDKCPDCEAEGTMTASCPKCHHEYRLIADATLAATQPAAQGMDGRDAAFEAVRKAFCKVQRYSFFLDSRGNVRRCADHCGNWVEFEAVHTLFDPQSVDAALAAQAKQGGV